MNKRQWFATTDPQAMLRFQSGHASGRKLRLFAVACCRRVWPAFAEDELSRRAVEAAERLADGTGTVKECRAARAAVEGPWGPDSDWRLRYMRHMAKGAAKSVAGAAALETASAALRLAGAPAVERYEGIATSSTDREAARVESAAQITSVRCIFGNPFRPLSCDSSWLTSDVLALCAACTSRATSAPCRSSRTPSRTRAAITPTR